MVNRTEQMVIDLYGQGKAISEIANRIGRTDSTVYMYLRKNGLMERTTQHQQEEEKRRQGLNFWKLNRMRRQTRVGKRIRVQSVKALMCLNESGNRNSIPAMARVVSTDSKYFCLVELPSGIRECVLWADMVGSEMDRY